VLASINAYVQTRKTLVQSILKSIGYRWPEDSTSVEKAQHLSLVGSILNALPLAWSCQHDNTIPISKHLETCFNGSDTSLYFLPVEIREMIGKQMLFDVLYEEVKSRGFASNPQKPALIAATLLKPALSLIDVLLLIQKITRLRLACDKHDNHFCR